LRYSLPPTPATKKAERKTVDGRNDKIKRIKYGVVVVVVKDTQMVTEIKFVFTSPLTRL